MSGPTAAARAPRVRSAILCGAGAFPLEVAGEARRAGREPFLVGVVGATNSAIEAYPHVWVRMGEVGKLFAALKERAIAEMVIIGAMTRPEFADLRLDWGAVKRAAGTRATVSARRQWAARGRRRDHRARGRSGGRRA